jgi:hypothetical protein
VRRGRFGVCWAPGTAARARRVSARRHSPCARVVPGRSATSCCWAATASALRSVRSVCCLVGAPASAPVARRASALRFPNPRAPNPSLVQTRTLTRNSAAKNLALAGVKSLTLCDPKPVALPDLSSQFYFGEADVGKNRAEVSAAALSDLNPYCEIKVHAGEVSGATIKPYQVRPSAVAPNARQCFTRAPPACAPLPFRARRVLLRPCVPACQRLRLPLVAAITVGRYRVSLSRCRSR